MLLFYLVLYLRHFMNCLMIVSLSILSLMVYLMLSLSHLLLSRILELIEYITSAAWSCIVSCFAKKSCNCVNNHKILIKIDFCYVKLVNLVKNIYKVFIFQLVNLKNPLIWFTLIFGGPASTLSKEGYRYYTL